MSEIEGVMTLKKSDSLAEKVARAIAENYDGYADPVETPQSWARAISAAHDAMAVIRDEFYASGNSSGDEAADFLNKEMTWNRRA